MLWNRENIREGMTVRSADGEKLGKVIALGDTHFEIEKGLFVLKDYVVAYSDIKDIQGGECFLRFGKEELKRAGSRGTATTDTAYATGPGNLGYAAGATERTGDIGREGIREETTIPLASEHLEVSKRDASAGEVRIHKTVDTETETVDVPLRRERVSVERVPATGGEMRAGSSAFQDEDIVVPVRAEEADVRKETEINEELRVKKTPYEETKRISETVRKERAEVRADGDVETEEGRSLGWKGEDPNTRY